jgi:hypothetical protein
MKELMIETEILNKLVSNMWINLPKLLCSLYQKQRVTIFFLNPLCVSS